MHLCSTLGRVRQGGRGGATGNVSTDRPRRMIIDLPWNVEHLKQYYSWKWAKYGVNRIVVKMQTNLWKYGGNMGHIL